jgi:hypothetical protein
MSGGLDQARADSANATNAQNDALSGMISGVGSAIGAGVQGGAFSKGANASGGAVVDTVDTEVVETPQYSEQDLQDIENGLNQ